MPKELYFDSIPLEYKYKYLGQGTNGSCYLTKDGKVFKEYKECGLYDEDTKRLLDLNYDGFTFPRQIIFIDGIFKGYIKDYAEGQTIETLDNLINIKKFIEALREFETIIMDFSYEEELYLYDLNLNNLLYNKKDNKIIDIDTDVISSFPYRITNPYYANLKELANNLEHRFYAYDFKSHLLNDIKNECIVGGYTRPSKLMEFAIKEMEKETKIETLNDYNKGLNLIIK